MLYYFCIVQCKGEMVYLMHIYFKDSFNIENVHQIRAFCRATSRGGDLADWPDELNVEGHLQKT